MKKRVWELDAFRGFCIFLMVAVHLYYDLYYIYGLMRGDYPWLVGFILDWGGILFLGLSGVCVTLGKSPVKRGLRVLASGLLCTAVTGCLYFLELQGPGIVIRFGVLHCLGVCMLLWPVFRRMPQWVLAAAAVAILVLGYWFRTITVENPWLFPLGLARSDFSSSDYFPILPSLGWFLLGAVFGRRLYGSRQTLYPNFPAKAAPIRALSWCGRHSLILYLLHQPVLMAVLEVYILLQ